MSDEMDLSELPDQAADQDGGTLRTARDLEAVYDIPVTVSAVLGKATMQVSQLLKLGRGAGDGLHGGAILVRGGCHGP